MGHYLLLQGICRCCCPLAGRCGARSFAALAANLQQKRSVARFDCQRPGRSNAVYTYKAYKSIGRRQTKQIAAKLGWTTVLKATNKLTEEEAP